MAGPPTISHAVGDDVFELEVPQAPAAGSVDGAFAHLLWNGGKVLADFLGRRGDVVRGKRVVELGAATALPSLVALRRGCAFACVCDLPRPRLLGVIRANVERSRAPRARCQVRGYQFYKFSPGALTMGAAAYDRTYGDGAPRVWPGPSRAAAVARRLSVAPADDGAFDVALVADMVYLHDLHAGLVDTLAGVLKPGGAAYVTFMHRFEGKEHGDLRFFDLARDAGLDSERLETHTMPREQAVGAEPPGTPAPVFLYRLTKREVT